ncbi:MAG: nucleotidyltransferase domain-containing protein [Caldilineaceae bacterium SB0675_bin_29]|uniref:Nucleotidyltransferase domain-containing protein n=1 Tax=Caldilineaceae bacterium SB0675_bin_29 TaxID=2605266 RepID=A0A6B1FXD8_9CHLR|nr:nucleotidyltransferase domain-containing protein [Caldilineaceae bacterium SB0675_bin_29]
MDRATIQAVAQMIAQKFDPEQIILFGSHARGNAGSQSDIDLLVVPKPLDDWSKRGNANRRAIGGQFIFPLTSSARRMTALRSSVRGF